MSSNTTNLGLYKADPVTDGENTFNIKAILNDNWDKIDSAVIAKLLEAKGYTDTQIQSLINAAPGLLNTLDELANALGDDPNFATTILNAIAAKSNQSDLVITNQNVADLDERVTSDLADLSSQVSGKGASLIGLNDSANKFTATNVEGAILELFTSANDKDKLIKTAIVGKGGTVLDANSDGIYTRQELADGVNSIKQGGGDAVETDVASGKTFTNADGVVRTGTNTNKKWASSSTMVSASSTKSFVGVNGSSSLQHYIQVTGLSFKPSMVTLYQAGGFMGSVWDGSPLVNGFIVFASDGGFRLTGNASLNADGFVLPSPYVAGALVYWRADE